MVTKTIVLAVGLALVAGVAVAKETVVRRSTDAGKAVDVWSHSSMRPDCSTKAPVVTIVQQPGNGTVSVNEGPRFLSGNRGDFAKCNGQTGFGSHIVYQPKAGFEGQDRLRYTVRFDSGTELTVSAQVRVGTVPRNDEGWHPASTADNATATPQQAAAR
ncbi:MAG: hypothetical protein BGP04_02055 [Rhizobiales bacterium 62-17]|nr:hypothetical protein [Hyphomicrobiales bacterium]OJY04224.1 MAG: hypothetical protein BGP04_02055 [Rhizobiales bacterium 62-17]